MYDMYLGGMQFPVVPSSISIKQAGKNKTVTLINEGEVNVLKAPGLQEISFEALFPNTSGAGISSRGNAGGYKDQLDGMLQAGVPVQFILNRELPNGKSLFSTNVKVAIENITYKDDVQNGFDLVASITLKEYKPYGTKLITITNSTKVAGVVTNRDSSTAPATGTSYSVNSGDSLWKIAKEKYGDGAQYKKIAEADKLTNPNKISPGQKLIIP